METNEIRNILTNSPLEVLATNESKLDSTVVDYEVYVPDYSIIRKDCNRSAGGVALYIRENLSHKQTVRIDLVPESPEMISCRDYPSLPQVFSS